MGFRFSPLYDEDNASYIGPKGRPIRVRITFIIHPVSGDDYGMPDTAAIYSAVSFDTTAFITETTHQDATVLYKSNMAEYLIDVTIIPISHNDRPLILATAGKPETDMYGRHF